MLRLGPLGLGPTPRRLAAAPEREQVVGVDVTLNPVRLGKMLVN